MFIYILDLNKNFAFKYMTSLADKKKHVLISLKSLKIFTDEEFKEIEYVFNYSTGSMPERHMLSRFISQEEVARVILLMYKTL